MSEILKWRSPDEADEKRPSREDGHGSRPHPDRLGRETIPSVKA